MGKEFKTYSEQITILNENKKIECISDQDQMILIRNGYFNLINGYKMPFTFNKDACGMHIYTKGTKISHLKSVKGFDDDLRMLLFKQISRIEEEIRTITGYAFDRNNKIGDGCFDQNSYDNNRVDYDKIPIFVTRLSNDVNASKSVYLKHYIETHNSIPTWIIVKVIRLSTFIDLLMNSNKKVKDHLCNLYGIRDKRGFSNYKLLIGSLHFMREIRNSCAHNERVFDISSSNRIDSEWYDCLPVSYRKSNRKEKRIVDFIIYLRYYLDDESYHTLIDNLVRLLMKLKTEIPVSSFDYIRGKMGIKDVNHLSLLKEYNKIIDYDSSY